MSATRENDPLLDSVPLVRGWHVLPPVVLCQKIGQGGMGAVYSGYHMHLGIDVAVKCLSPALGHHGAQFVERFQREANLAAKITHPNLVRIYDYRQAYGLHYLVMELVHGESARERVARLGPQSNDQAAAILLGTADALAQAHGHRNRVVHRDIKPDNILISRAGEVKLADLGIAKALQTDETAMVNTVGVIGTPRYMAPEQWEDGEDLGPPADVWSLGATLYFLLVGADAIEGQGQQQAYTATCQKPFPDVLLRCADASPELVAILHKCVAREPGERYRDAAELAAALRPLVENASATLRAADASPDDTTPLLERPTPELLVGIQREMEVTPTPGPAVLADTLNFDARPDGFEPTVLTAPDEESRPRAFPYLAALAVLAVGLVAGRFLLGGDEAPTRPTDGVQAGSSAEPVAGLAEQDEAQGEAQVEPVERPPEAPAEATADLQSDLPADQSAEATADSAAGVPAAEPLNEAEGEHEEDVPSKSLDVVVPQVAAAIPVVSLNDLELIDGVHYCGQPTLFLRGTVTDHVDGIPPEVSCNGQLVASEIIRTGLFHASIALPINQASRLRIAYPGAVPLDLEVVQDSRDPEVELLTPTASAVRLNTSSTEVKVRVTEAHLKQVLIGGVPVTPSEADASVYSAVLPLPVDGEHGALIRAEDLTGRRTRLGISVFRDTTPPQRLPSSPATGSAVETSANVEFRLTFDEDLRSYTVGGTERTLDNAFPRIGFSLQAPAVAGPWSVSGLAVDTAGNSAPFSLDLVAVAPEPPPVVIPAVTPDIAVPGTVTPDPEVTEPEAEPEPAAPSADVTIGRDVPDGWTAMEPADSGRWASRAKEPRSGIVFRLIPAGSFAMGSPKNETDRRDEERQHMVTLTRPFYLAETETTQEQYRRVTGDSPSKFRGAELPVERVNWQAATAFCESIQCELPTEAQWEYACRAGTQTPISFGSTIRGESVNFLGASSYPRGKSLNRRRTVRADGSDEKLIQPNSWGLYHMHGNVFEWCRDIYAAKAYRTHKGSDPVHTGPGKTHVIRGGSWETPGWDCRSAARNYAGKKPTAPELIGFRCSLTLPADDS